MDYKRELIALGKEYEKTEYGQYLLSLAKDNNDIFKERI